VLVTGASRGVGREISRLLTKLGSIVVGVHRQRSAQSRELARELGPKIRLVQSDLTRAVAAQELTKYLVAHDMRLKGVVLGAGILRGGPFVDAEIDGDDPVVAQLAANLQAPLVLLRALLRAERIVEGGAVVVVGSNLGHRGLEGRVAYSASKAGLEGAVRALARELGPRRIRVNAVAPGLLRTDMTAAVTEDGFAAYAQEVPLGRVGDPADVAPMVAFLLGEECSYITGQVIDIDGGWAV
jgi:3-oxoacyl-[acyl-carrier protein] reductase